MVRIKESSRGVEAGSQFGKWTVIGPPFSNGAGEYQAICRCTCGSLTVVTAHNLSGGQSLGCKPCGYRRKYKCRNQRLQSVWNGMKSRCYRDYDINYRNYGGRGIRICDEWLSDFDAFAEWALANGYEDTLQIDRIDNDGNYEPGNCRFVTRSVNSNNCRANRLVVGFGEQKTLTEWGRDERCVVKWQTLQARLNQGRSLEDALTTPVH